MNVLNTLFVATQDAYIAQNHETLEVRTDGRASLIVPMHHLSAVACFGRVSVSPHAMFACMARGISVAYFTERGRFLGRVEGQINGNVMVRHLQHRISDDEQRSLVFVRGFVAGKLSNERTMLLRAIRDYSEPEDEIALIQRAADGIGKCLRRAPEARSIDRLRGLEGQAAAWFFEAFPYLIRRDRDAWGFSTRNRRPPMDPANALLSFIYSLVLSDALSAVTGAGLDPNVGFLHVHRPGRPSLALDLMEEFRPVLAERLALALINRGQLRPSDFVRHGGGSYQLRDGARKLVLTEYQERKRYEVLHPVLEQRMPLGYSIHAQARILGRCIRGDAAEYLPFLIR